MLTLEENVLLVTQVHVLSLTMIKVSKRNIRQSFEGCRQTFEHYKITFVYTLVNIGNSWLAPIIQAYSYMAKPLLQEL